MMLSSYMEDLLLPILLVNWNILHEENNLILTREGLFWTTTDEDGMITPEIKNGPSDN